MLFDWDEGNLDKVQKHGVAVETIEAVLSGEPAILTDPFPTEARFRAIGRGPDGRHVYIVFTLRELDGELRVRPISARHMHEREIASYEAR